LFFTRWSPDGTKIVFTRVSANGTQSNICTVNADGSGLSRVTSTGNASQPDWGRTRWRDNHVRSNDAPI
jgi:Tol biopolymer transport system component